jgi:hypothetical protein
MVKFGGWFASLSSNMRIMGFNTLTFFWLKKFSPKQPLVSLKHFGSHIIGAHLHSRGSPINNLLHKRRNAFWQLQLIPKKQTHTHTHIYNKCKIKIKWCDCKEFVDLWDFDWSLDLEISPHVEILMTLHSSLFWNSQNHYENFLLTWRLERFFFIPSK